MRVVLILLLSAMSVAQTTKFSGNQKLQGNFTTSSTTSSGGPLVYTARSYPADNCVHGYSTNAPTVAPFYNPANETCISGRTTGEIGSALVYQAGPTDPIPFTRLDAATNPAVMNTPYTDTDFLSYITFASDNSGTYPGTPSTVRWIMGSDGAQDAFGIGQPPLGNSPDVMIRIQNNGAVPFLAHVVESRLLSHLCTPTLPCVIPSNIVGTLGCVPDATNYSGGSPPYCTHTQISTGAVTFSRNQTNPPNTGAELYLPKIFQDAFTEGISGGFPTGVDSVTRSVYADFAAAGVIPTDYNSLWNGTFTGGDNGEFTLASGGGGSYQTLSQHPGVTCTTGCVVNTDVFIAPVNNTPTGTGWMWQITTAGTTSGTEPTWKNATSGSPPGCPALGNTCTDGTAVWTNIGKVNTQGPGFDLLHYDPVRGISYYNTRTTKMFRGTNEGPNYPSSGPADPSGQVYSDDTVTCYRMGGSSCGTGGTVPFTDQMTLHAASTPFQGKYSVFTPTTGVTFITSPVYSCTSGSIAYTSYQTWPNPVFTSGGSYTNAKYVTSPVDNNYYKLTGTTGTYTTDPSADPTHWSNQSAACPQYYMDWNAGIVRPALEIGPDFGASSHSQSGYLFDFRGGAFFSHYFSQPQCSTNVFGTPGCDGGTLAPFCTVVNANNNYVGAPNPGCKSIPSSLNIPADYHPSGRNFGTADLQPLFLFSFQQPAWGGVGVPGSATAGTGVGGYCCVAYMEITAFTLGGNPTLYRFAHNHCTGSNATFSVGQCIGVVSQDGLMAMWGSDFDNTRGDAISGSTTCAHPQRAQYLNVKSGAVTYLDNTLPSANNANFNIYQAVGFYTGTFPSGSYVASGTGTEGTALPNWGSATLGAGCPTTGQYCTADHGNNPATSQSLDGNVLWLNLGPNTCRSDIGLIDLTSAHAAP